MIPIFKTNDLGEYWECQVCHRTFEPTTIPQWEVGITWEQDIDKELAESEIVLIAPGVKVTKTRTRTIDHSIALYDSATTTSELGGKFDTGSLNISLINIGPVKLGVEGLRAEIKGAVKRERIHREQAVYNETFTVSEDIQLDGNVATHYKLMWFDLWRRGTAQFYGANSEFTYPFRYRESTTLEVQAITLK